MFPAVRVLLGAALVATFFSGSSQAVIVTSNLSGALGGANGVSSDPGWVAQKFFNGPTSETLLSIDAKISKGGNASMWIFSDSAGLPGSMLGSFDINPPANSYVVGNNFPYTGPTITLAPSTPYWIVAGAPTGTANYVWGYTGSASTGPGSIPQNWAFTGIQNGPWTPQTGFAYFLQVNVVPEPASMSLLAFGAAMLRRRR